MGLILQFPARPAAAVDDRPPRLLSKAEAAARAGRSVSWVDKQLAAGLPHRRRGGRVYVTATALTAWVAA